MLLGVYACGTAGALLAAYGASSGGLNAEVAAVIVGVGVVACAVRAGMWRAADRCGGARLAEAERSASRSREVESRLAEAGELIEGVLRSMEGGVVLLDAQHRVLSMNASAEVMLEASGRAVRGRLVQEVALQPELNRFIDEALESGADNEAELALRGRTDRTVRASCRVVRDGGGRTSGLLVVMNDITHLRRLETVRSDFAANVSHELRTPITNIKGYVEAMLDLDPSHEAARMREFLSVVKRNIERVSAIIDDMLTLTLLERPGARESLALERAVLSPIVEGAFAGLAREAEAKSIRLINEIPADLEAEVNAALMEQALANLVSNAVRYSPAGSRVWVRGGRAGGEGRTPSVYLEVADEGPGIAEEHLDRIFERFYRVDRARSRDSGGTGLGLAIVKHIVNVHGGRMEVDSAVGRGSTFRLIIPEVLSV